MKNISLLHIFIALTFILLADCSPDTPVHDNKQEPTKVETLTIDGLDDNIWVYISLENGLKVGTSLLGYPEQDALWRTRRDWDIAFCGEMIRTNGGTSGNGSGAIQSIPNKNFNAFDEAPVDNYDIDTDDVIIHR